MAKGITKHDYSPSGFWKVYPNNGKSKVHARNEFFFFYLFKGHLKAKIYVNKIFFLRSKMLPQEIRCQI